MCKHVVYGEGKLYTLVQGMCYTVVFKQPPMFVEL